MSVKKHGQYTENLKRPSKPTKEINIYMCTLFFNSGSKLRNNCQVNNTSIGSISILILIGINPDLDRYKSWSWSVSIRILINMEQDQSGTWAIKIRIKINQFGSGSICFRIKSVSGSIRIRTNLDNKCLSRNP